MDDHQPGDSVPHMRETRITCTADGWEIEGRHSVDWWKQYRDVFFSVNEANHFSMGKASGDECNCLIPQTVFTLRGSVGVGREGLWCLSGPVRGARPF